MKPRYYTLIASLPALEYFETAKRVPINRVRLNRRLGMLEPEDTVELRRCEQLIGWRSHDLEAEAKRFAQLYEQLRTKFVTQVDMKQAIGKRYARMDEAGTPFCFTIDGDTLTNQTVTMRDRDTGAQERIAIDQVERFLSDKIR